MVTNLIAISKGRRLTAMVQFGPDEDKGRKETTRYSKVGPLLITRSIEDDGRDLYVITHTASGLRIARTDRLVKARQALALLLPLTDWSKGRRELEYDTVLLAKVRETLFSLGVHISTRKC